MSTTIHGRLIVERRVHHGSILSAWPSKVTARFGESAAVFTAEDGTTTAIHYRDVQSVTHAIGGRWVNGKLHLDLANGKTAFLDDIRPDPALEYAKDRYANPLICEAADRVTAYMQAM